jgi:hypothetical protein
VGTGGVANFFRVGIVKDRQYTRGITWIVYNCILCLLFLPSFEKAADL